MNRRMYSTTALAVLLLLLSPAARAQSDDLEPLMPLAPPAAATQSGQQMDVEVHALDTVRASLADASKATQTFSFSSSDSLPKTPISLKVRDSKVKDALKNALEQAKIDYILDDDIPDDPKVTLEVANVRIGAVLDLLTENAGVNWRTQTKDGKTIVHVGKKIRHTDVWQAFSSLPALSGLSGSSNTRLLMDRDAFKAPYMIQYASSESRLTFTCSNCHNQVTIVRKNVAAKCPTCGRTFESDWKVCPFDGTARPVAQDTWKFCPICAFPIPQTVAAPPAKDSKDTKDVPPATPAAPTAKASGN